MRMNTLPWGSKQDAGTVCTQLRQSQVKEVGSIVLLLQQGVRFWAAPSLFGSKWCCTRRQQAGSGRMKANRKAESIATSNGNFLTLS